MFQGDVRKMLLIGSWFFFSTFNSKRKKKTNTPMVSSVFVAGALALGAVMLLRPQPNCARTVPAALARPAVHVDLGHLVGNLFAFYLLSQSIQPRIGTLNYIMLIAFLWLTTALMDLVFQQRCAVGFSAVVLGLLVWDMFDRGELKFDLTALAVLAVTWLQPLATGQHNVSMSGHLMGIVAGLIAVVATRALRKRAAPEPTVVVVRTPQG